MRERRWISKHTHIEERSAIEGCPRDLTGGCLPLEVLSDKQLLAYELRRKHSVVRTKYVPAIFAGKEELHARLDRRINQGLLLVELCLRPSDAAYQSILTK